MSKIMLLEVLSRAQFGFSIGFHILFPTLNLGLGLYLVIMEACWLFTQKPVYLDICKFWTKVFALTFGMGVVSGIVLAYQIGTNFGPFIIKFGEILGALFAYETLTAFFLEAGFLGVMLFGWKRVPPWLHFCATLMVVIGTSISAFWIMSANSWMQTPSGYSLTEDHFKVASWWDIVFNPSFFPRFLHMLFASYTTTCFVVAAVGAYFLRNGYAAEFGKKCLSFSLLAALIVVPIQIGIGDQVGLVVHEHQPMKTAAMEGVWETEKGAPLILFAWPSQVLQKNEFVIAIPKLASFLNTHDWNGELVGLSTLPFAEQPSVAPVFFSFRIMVGIGILLLLTAIVGSIFYWRGNLYTSRRFQWWCILMAPTGFIAAIAGWLTAEIGRQPWVVYNLMHTREAVSLVGMEEVIISMTLLLITYGIIFLFYLYFILKLIRTGPLTRKRKKTEDHSFQYMTVFPKEE
jgi:cytochrome d ubiquinol oxidase subunit I